jgi:hypothetical protein
MSKAKAPLSWDERSALALAIVKQATEAHRVVPIQPLRKPVARALDRLQAAEQQLLRDQAEMSKDGRRRVAVFLAALDRVRNAAGNLPPHLLNVIRSDPHFEQLIGVWQDVCETTLSQEDRREGRDDAVLRKAAVDSAHQLMLDFKLPVQQPVRTNSAFCKLAAVLLGYPKQDLQRDCAIKASRKTRH